MICYFLLFALALASERTFELGENEFLLDGKKFQYVGGAFHYFRTHPDYWEDRILKMKAAGLNGIETYVAWNLHQPERDVFNWEGYADILKFIELVKKHDMYLLLRVGPYVCAEWDFGGIPYWVISTEGMVHRMNNQPWKDAVTSFLDVLLPKIQPHLYINGGNILMVQVENEYGSFACDYDYLHWIVSYFRSKLGDKVILFTTDGYNNVKCGTVEEVYSTVDFGTSVNPKTAFNNQRKYQANGPLMNSEFYPGWLSHWNEKFQRVDTGLVVNHLKTMLEMNASVNFYMFLGGTNWGFYNGANGEGDIVYQPDTTSYDYDAPLTEAGDITDKYLAIRDYLKTYLKKDLPEVPKNTTKAAYGNLTCDGYTNLLLEEETLKNQTKIHKFNSSPIKFEQLGADLGYVLYRTNISGNNEKTLTIHNIRDRVTVYVNGEYKGYFMRQFHILPETVKLGNSEGVLDLIVENMGRLNFGAHMWDPKGFERPTINGYPVENWDMFTLPMTNTINLRFNREIKSTGPAFYHFTLNIDGKPADTFLNMKNWHKGHVSVNNFNLGRHWEVGPQYTLYIPAPLLKEGKNDIVVFDFIGIPDNHQIISQDTPILG